MRVRPFTKSLQADADCADDVRRDLLAALDDLTSALKSCCPNNRQADAGDMMLVRSRAQAAAYRLGEAEKAITAHIMRHGEVE